MKSILSTIKENLLNESIDAPTDKAIKILVEQIVDYEQDGDTKKLKELIFNILNQITTEKEDEMSMSIVNDWIKL